MLVADQHVRDARPPSALAAISPNLIAAEPTVDGIARALCDATARADDVGARVRGSAVRWPRDWDESFDEALLDRLASLLAAD